MRDPSFGSIDRLHAAMRFSSRVDRVMLELRFGLPSGTLSDSPFHGRMIGIIDSMTDAERQDPVRIDSRRVRRIAAGSGVSISDVTNLLRSWAQIHELMGQLDGGEAE